MLEVLLKTLVALGLLAVGAAYARGWRRLRAARDAAPRWRLALYAAGLATIAVALLSPLDALAAERFSAHMGQHLLLTMVAAPLVVLGNPLPFVLWGAPAGARRALGTTLRRRAPLRTALSALTFLPVAGILHVTGVWVWHLPFMYDAAAEQELVHAVEHATFFGTAILFWWPIVQPAPRLRPPPHPGFQILYLLLATAQNTALGMLLAVPERPYYPYYVRRAAALGISAVDDQLLGAGLMWSGGHMYLLPILMILWGLARDAVREEAGA
ncbi:MAG: cytochrome c oxidase assembly protein [Candidatus Rokuibacteriota bacterium]|nr:MAG: cytochrome c oxidase assembly protein [Candidatus Rokubacteria bacterium]PYM61880.1 MAG: cytochrome c oxidase assembly protein [Candidatus Rokubacteria bacterium]PYN66258.1 MAG: cytochrome c oxidase assembly protein [Candidatus Rokubacteria bacterium]